MALAFGARTGVRRTATPNSFTDLSSCWEKMLSRSWITYRYPWPPGSASRNCCRVHSAVGCAVTFLWIIRRVAISRITNTYRAVTTVKKSQATITLAWFRTKVSHRCWGSGARTRPPTCRYFSTVRGETRIPSFNCNSLAMRSSPQVTFSAAICRINCRRFFGKRGLPDGFDFQRQNSRNPLRCQRMSVSAWTFTSAPRHGNMRLSIAIIQRVESLARRGLTLRSWKSASCLRRKRFSAARARRECAARKARRSRSTTTEEIVRKQWATVRISEKPGMNAQDDTLPNVTGSRFRGKDFLRSTPLLLSRSNRNGPVLPILLISPARTLALLFGEQN